MTEAVAIAGAFLSVIVGVFQYQQKQVSEADKREREAMQRDITRAHARIDENEKADHAREIAHTKLQGDVNVLIERVNRLVTLLENEYRRGVAP